MFLAWKELKHNKARYSLIMTILVLVVFLVLFLAGLAKGLSAATSSAIDNAKANYYLLDDGADNLIPRSSLTKEQLDIVKELTSNVTPINLQRATITNDLKETKLDITYMAIDKNDFMMPKVIEGNSLNDTNEIVLNLSFKDDGFRVGDTIYDSTSGLELKVVGFIKNQMYGHSPIGVISLDTFADIKLSVTGISTGYQAIAIESGSIVIADNLYKSVNNSLDNTVLLTKDELISNIPGHSQEQGTILMMLGFLLVISSFIIGVFFYVTTMQKLPQFGVLKALGAKMSTLSTSVILQVLILSSISLIIGNLLTFGMASVLPVSMPFVLAFRDAGIVSLLFLVISLLSSLFSIRKIGRVDAISVIGGNE